MRVCFLNSIETGHIDLHLVLLNVEDIIYNPLSGADGVHRPP